MDFQKVPPTCYQRCANVDEWRLERQKTLQTMEKGRGIVRPGPES